MQLGVGMAAAQQVIKALNNTPANAPMAPPPLPTDAAPALYHVALDGKSQGPLTLTQVADLIAHGKVTGDTQIWRPGIPAWVPARSEAALAGLFPQQPPPLP